MAPEKLYGLPPLVGSTVQCETVVSARFREMNQLSHCSRAPPASAPHNSEMRSTTDGPRASLKRTYAAAERAGTKPAIVYDADDTTLWTYDMEVADMKFVFDPERPDYWEQHQLVPAWRGGDL